MEFRIANTFTDSLAKLTAEEQKAVKTTAFDLQLNPANPGMKFHKLERIKDKNFWSVRVNDDIRLIVHRTDNSLMLCYVDHHDEAYQWARNRKLEIHPKTGVAQLVKIREAVKEIAIPKYVHKKVTKHPILSDISNEELLSYGVPPEWLDEVREADEDALLDIVEHLPEEAAEALLNLATGDTPPVMHYALDKFAPFDHPDAQRRFRLMNNIEELKQALEYPWEKWTVFLHPAQKELVEGDYSGPVRVSGSAGTGKTIVALHRAVFLARNNPDSRILLTTFSDALANVLRTKLKRLIGNEPRIMERVEVHAINAIGLRLFEFNFGQPNIASHEEVKKYLTEATCKLGEKQYNINFLMKEWENVVDAWQLHSWEEYRDVTRLGRKTRLSEKQRDKLWRVFAYTKSKLNDQCLITYSDMFSQLSSRFSQIEHPPFDFVVVDEAQDLSVSQLRFLSVLGKGRPNSLFFTGDLGQRIFQQPFSWKALGVDIRGRSKNLRINYRTSHQIRTQADRLLPPEISDVDGVTEERKGTISVFNGPKPTIMVLDNTDIEIKTVSSWLADRICENVKPHEIGVFVRSASELERARNAVSEAGLEYKVLDDNVETTSGYVSISTMHLAKGMEFRAVVVMACDDEVIPLQERIETVADETDLEEVYKTERHLLYVACTRARDHLLVTSVAPASEFLDDLE